MSKTLREIYEYDLIEDDGVDYTVDEWFNTIMEKTKDQLDVSDVSRMLLYPALFCMTAGIFIGAIWANVSWGTYWSWDPKETWALITLMIYAAPAHRTFSNLSTMKYHIYMALAFFTILMTYLGVNYFLGGMHSYA